MRAILPERLSRFSSLSEHRSFPRAANQAGPVCLMPVSSGPTVKNRRERKRCDPCRESSTGGNFVSTPCIRRRVLSVLADIQVLWDKSERGDPPRLNQWGPSKHLPAIRQPLWFSLRAGECRTCLVFDRALCLAMPLCVSSAYQIRGYMLGLRGRPFSCGALHPHDEDGPLRLSLGR